MKQQSLEQIGERLRTSVDSAAVFNCVNTRLIIQLGVNLKRVTPEQNDNPTLTRQVLEALGKMGVSLKGREA